MGDGTEVPLRTIVREWTRIGVTGFGGPPAHIVLLRRLCVQDRGWLTAGEFVDGIAATNLLPGPASTQLAIYCAWRVRGRLGGVVGGLCFIVPGLVAILALSVVVLAAHPPRWVEGAAAGAAAAVPAVAVRAATELVPASWRRSGHATSERARWLVYAAVGAVATVVIGEFLVLALLACGLAELVARGAHRRLALLAAAPSTAPVVGGLLALVWVAFKVGALAYGGGFVIVPLMQHDAVSAYHWMTGTQFLDAVALGQLTPGPVVQTVAVVGYAAAGLAGGLLAATVAFAPSFLFVLVGGSHFDRLRSSPGPQSFLSGAGPAAIGAIAGSSVLLGRDLLHLWQLGVLVLAVGWLLVLRRGVIPALLAAAALGTVAALAGAAVTG